MILEFDMIQSLGIAIIFLLIGTKLKKKFYFLEKYCIPNPVIGGLLFSIIALFLHLNNIINFKFDTTLQTFFMIMFFTSIGFNAKFSLFKTGGKKLIYFLIISIVLIMVQNITPLFLSKILNLNPLLSLMTGSIALTGGHATSSAIAGELNIEGAKTIAISTATFGLIAGSLLGPNLAKNIIKKYNLKSNEIKNEEVHLNKKLDENKFFNAFFTLILSMAIGSFLNMFFKYINLNMPVYIGPMFVAMLIRNFSDIYNKELAIEEIRILENVSLSIFLSLALITLKLWELIDLAIPLIILLIVQTIMTYLFVRFITFNFMGKDYDAAIMSAGHIGFGMGATPNALANMKTLTEIYGYSSIAFLIIPIVGTLFIDFFNVSIISFFIYKLL